MENNKKFERKTGLGPATPTLARLCSTNWAISATNKHFFESEEEETRTPTTQLSLPPQSSASTNSATSPLCSMWLFWIVSAQNRTRTCTSLNTRTWNVRVYQFRHLGILVEAMRLVCYSECVSGKRDSDPRPQPWQGCALPTELFPQDFLFLRSISLDCGCKGSTFFWTHKLFRCFFSFFLQKSWFFLKKRVKTGFLALFSAHSEVFSSKTAFVLLQRHQSMRDR